MTVATVLYQEFHGQTKHNEMFDQLGKEENFEGMKLICSAKSGPGLRYGQGCAWPKKWLSSATALSYVQCSCLEEFTDSNTFYELVIIVILVCNITLSVVQFNKST